MTVLLSVYDCNKYKIEKEICTKIDLWWDCHSFALQINVCGVREKKKHISTTKSGTNNWFNWCGAWMRLINTIESVAKHVKQSVKKSDRLVKCYKLFSIHVRPISVRVEKKRRDTVKYTNLLKSFWIAARKSIEKLDTSDTQMIHAQYFVTNVFAIRFCFCF